MRIVRNIHPVAALVAVVTAASVGSLHIHMPEAAAAGAAPVLVTNTTGQAVPVAGTIGVGALPAVQIAAGQTIGISNPPTSAIPVRDVDLNGRQGFTLSTAAVFSVNATES